MTNFISLLFAVIGIVIGIVGLITQPTNSIHQILNQLCFVQMFLSFIVAGVFYKQKDTK